MHTRETEKNALITRRITILLDCSLHILKDTFVFEVKCLAAGGRLEPDPTAARRAAGESCDCIESCCNSVRLGDTGSNDTVARPGSGNDSDDAESDSARRAAGRRVKARPLRPGQQGRVSLNLECRLARPCGSPGRRLGRPGAVARGPGVGAGPLQPGRPAGRPCGGIDSGGESLSRTRPGVLAPGIRAAGSLSPRPGPGWPPVTAATTQHSHGD